MAYNYKPFFTIPVILLVFSVGYLVNGYLQTGEWFLRSIDLKGGTVITLKGVSGSELESSLAGFGAQVRKIGGFGGEGVLIQIPAEVPAQNVLDALKERGFPTEDASVQTVGPALGESFWQQAQISVVLAFALMGMVIFFLFRRLVPCFTIIYTTAFDIVETLAVMQIIGLPLSLPGLGALLMLIGYSVDTDVLLDSSMFKKSGTVQEKFKAALKTGLTMSITTLGVLAVLIVVGISPVITEIATVLMIGLILDLANTWFMNAGVLMMYVEKRGG